MNLPGISIKRKTTFLMIFLLLAGAGFFAITQLGIDYLPDVNLGNIVIVTTMPGAAPEEMENLVSEIIEDAVSGVEGVKTIESESKYSSSIVTLQISWSADFDEVESDIREQIEKIKSQLPSRASDPIIMALASSNKPLFILGFTSEVLSSAELRLMIEDEIVPILSRVEGVASTQISGGDVRQINVRVNPVILGELDISITEIYGALAAVRSDQPGGNIDDGETDIALSIKSGFRSLEEIENLVIGRSSGMPVRLGDVAIVSDGYQEAGNYLHLNHGNAILITIRRSSDANTVNTCERLESVIERTISSYSDKVNIEIIYSQKSFVISSMKDLLWTGLQAILLAAAVLLFFLGSMSNSGIVSISMPFSFVVTFAAMYLLGVNLNIMSLAGLSISIGMIVDNSVVVIENIHRHRREGSAIKEAAEQGTNQVSLAVAASTLTTVVVFIPMLFVKGMTGQVFKDLSITIVCALFISLFVSQSLVPLLSSRSKKLLVHHRKGSLLDKIQIWIHLLEERYSRLVSWSTSHVWQVLVPVVLFFLLSMFLFSSIPKSFLPDPEEGIIEVDMKLAAGTSLEFADSLAVAVEDSILAIIEPGDLRSAYLNVGRSEGVGAAFGLDASYKAELNLFFVGGSERSVSVDEYADRIREIISGFPGVEFSLSSGMPIGNEYPIEVIVYGSDLDELREIGLTLKREIDRIPGTTDIVSTLDDRIIQINFVPDETVLSLSGISPARVAGEMTTGILGLDASMLYDENTEIDINVRYSEDYRSSREAVAAITALGAPLDSWGSFNNVLVPRSIGRRDRSRTVSVLCKIRSRALSSVASDLQSMLDTLDLRGHRYEIAGDIVDQKESFASMSIAIIVAIILVYMVMASQFESLLEPFLLIFEIPLALTGVAWTLFLTGTTMGITALVGLLMLAGLVVNNGIVLIDFAKQIRAKEGIGAREAVIRAGRTRLRPVLMTTATTIFALMPLAIGGSDSAVLWSPMARTVAGGLFFATPLTLIVLPALYVSLDKWRKKTKTT